MPTNNSNNTNKNNNGNFIGHDEDVNITGEIVETGSSAWRGFRKSFSWILLGGARVTTFSLKSIKDAGQSLDNNVSSVQDYYNRDKSSIGLGIDKGLDDYKAVKSALFVNNTSTKKKENTEDEKEEA